MKIKKLIWECLLVFLCTYVCMPFFIAKYEALNKCLFYMFSIMPVIWYLVNHTKIGTKEFRYISYLLFYIGTVIAVFIVSGAKDISYLVYFLRLLQRLLAMISLYLLWNYLYIKRWISFDFGTVYIYSVLFYIITTIFFIIFPEAKLSWANQIVTYQKLSTINRAGYLTRYGISGWASFGTAVWVSTAFIYVFYQYLNRQSTLGQTRVYTIFLIMGSLFYGRSGMVLSSSILLMFIIYCLFSGKSAYPVYIAGVLILTIVSIIILYNSVESSREYMNWAFESIINYLKGNGLMSGSGEELKNMYKNFDLSIRTFLIGDGKWLLDNGKYYGQTDVGFMRNILFGGIFYTAAVYGCMLYYLVLLARKMKEGNDNGIMISIFLMLIIFILCEFKGDMTFSLIKFFLPFYYIAGSHSKYRNNIGRKQYDI